MRIVYWARLQLAKSLVIEQLSAVPGVELVVAENLPSLLGALPGAAGVVLYDAPPSEARQVVASIGASGNTVRWLHFLTAGREGFDAVGIPAGVAVTYAAGGASPAVAEHAMALLLALGRRVPEMLAQQALGRWDRAPATRASSLEGKTMAIVGFGHIGRELAGRARPFGAKIIGLSRSPKPDPLLDEAQPLSELHAVLARSDVVVIAIALTAQTRHLFDRAAFAAIKPGAHLVNVARGGVVDHGALIEALTSGKLGGAGLDVTDPEPLPDGDPLWSCPNLILSPHYAGGGSAATLTRLAGGAAENLRRFAAGGPLLNQISA
jgi:phosphoglycerate dehydrogenase-like enzyme